jgi:hypothetical protein
MKKNWVVIDHGRVAPVRPTRLQRWRLRRLDLRLAGLMLTVILGLGTSGYGFLQSIPSGWTIADMANHLAAARNCDAARAVGLAPARRGRPGYWPNHDADKDGIACEPYRGR